MSRRASSIVPRGFELTAHPIFAQFSLPLYAQRSDDNAFLRFDVGDDGPVKENDNVSALTALKADHLTNDDVDKNGCENEHDQVGWHTCSICISPLENPVTVVNCTHSYCFTCLYTWYKSRRACPLCNVEATAFVKFADDDRSLINSSSFKAIDKSILNKSTTPGERRIQLWDFIEEGCSLQSQSRKEGGKKRKFERFLRRQQMRSNNDNNLEDSKSHKKTSSLDHTGSPRDKEESDSEEVVRRAIRLHRQRFTDYSLSQSSSHSVETTPPRIKS